MLTAAALLLALGAAQAPHDPSDVAAALKRWHKGYVSGDVHLHEPAAEGPKSPIYKRLLGDRGPTITHRQGLSKLFDMAIDDQTVELARIMLRLAAVDRDGKRVDPRQRPAVVRSAAISSLGRFTEMRPIYAILEAAQGRPEDWKTGWHDGIQAAAVRALGAIDKPVARPLIQKACGSNVSDVRLAAAQALHAMGPPRSLRAICTAMERELNPIVAEQLAETARAILQRHVDQCGTADVRRTVHTAIGMLGRTDWRADLAVVELCAAFRNRAAIEPLICVLERFRDHPEDIDRGRLSGLLRHRAHEVLESLTGARIPATEPANWRAFWDRVGSDFVLAKAKDKAAAKTSAGFFGIPIKGSRIVFVIDLSGSMKAVYQPSSGSAGEARTRYQHARAELLRAAEALPPDARFNVITFAQSVKQWREKFAQPTKANVRTLRNRLHQRKPDGGTNLFGALEKALDIRLSQLGARYDSPVDEIFLLSDGAPSAGKIVNTAEILSVVQQANERRKVRINTVFIGPEAGSGFMRALASQNQGHFVRL